MGILVIDKPVGPTSYDVVRRVQRALHRLLGFTRPKDLKIGHGGTLDPLASGVLPVCVGEGTKIAAFLLDADKEYEAEVRFGVQTDTLDAAGVVLAESPVHHLTEVIVLAALAGFRGAIEQVPPMYSALKHKGRPLYAYAREGQDIARSSRSLTIHELVLQAWTPPATARLRIRCSKGTYVRVLAADLGLVLGVGAHLAGLRRTASGPFNLAQAVTLEDLERDALAGRLPVQVGLADALGHLFAVTPNEELSLALWQGKRVSSEALGLADDAAGQLRVLRADGTLLAIAEALDGMVRSLRGFNHEVPGAGSAASPGTHPMSRPLSSESGSNAQLLGSLGLTSPSVL